MTKEQINKLLSEGEFPANQAAAAIDRNTYFVGVFMRPVGV